MVGRILCAPSHLRQVDMPLLPAHGVESPLQEPADPPIIDGGIAVSGLARCTRWSVVGVAVRPLAGVHYLLCRTPCQQRGANSTKSRRCSLFVSPAHSKIRPAKSSSSQKRNGVGTLSTFAILTAVS